MDAPSTTSPNQLLTVPAETAHTVFAASKYAIQVQQTCFDKCVVDFQTADIGAFEKECANACIQKHLTMWKQIVKQ